MGRLGRPHGLDGFLGLYVEEEDVDILQPGETVHIGGEPYTIRAIRRVDRGHQIAFDGVDDRFDAEAIRGMDLLVDERRELRTGEYWPGDLIGLAVFDTNGKSLGMVKDVLFGPAQDRLLI
ncbi:MAG TPA: PRC-barrel domain-containing protein, partial [Acidimicrobiia bacterium]